MPVFYAKPTEKEVITKLIFSNKKELHDFLEADKAKGYKGSYIVTVERERSKRSLSQNDYLWGVVYKTISNHTGHTMNEIHEY